MTAKIAYLDIERTWGVAEGIWQLKQDWINPSQIIEQPRTICFAWKFEGDQETSFHAEWFRGGHAGMVKKAHTVLDDADVVVTFNGIAFDLKHLRSEFLLHDMAPPSPWKDVDLLKVARKNFGFLSNRMGFLAEQLGLDGKADTGGQSLWRTLRNAKGDELKAGREKMANYNRVDVDQTQELYHLMLPWVSGLNLPAFTEKERMGPHCPNCDSANVQYRGLARTTTRSYRRFQCQDCGKWGRETSSAGATGQVSL